jgi:hypothetical protein
MMKITLRYFDGCPNWQIARARLQEAMDAIGYESDIQLERIETPEEADRVSSVAHLRS